MPRISRRVLFTGAGSAALGVAVAGPVAAQPAGRPVPPGPVDVTPGDPRYQDLLLRRFNKRLVSQPEHIHIVGTTDHVVRVVDDAVAAGKRVVARSGGHSLDGVVDAPDTQVVVDFTEMRAVRFDPDRDAFMVEPGATLAEVYRTLDYGWGVTLPGGVYPTVGAGGHIPGNGFGAQSRLYGGIADHLYAIEIVVVGADGRARAVVATRERTDPNRGLWWAHTGAGGGNFGLVTRFWFRSPDATSSDPTALLPKAPKSMLLGRVVVDWSTLTEADFVRLAANWGTWVEQNSAPGAPGAALYGAFNATSRAKGSMFVIGQVDPTIPGAESVLDGYLAAVTAGLTARPVKIGPMPWLTNSTNAPDAAASQGVLGQARWKTKVAYLRKRFTDDQARTIHAYLTRADYQYAPANLAVTTSGGRINAVAPDATATPHRSSTMVASVNTVWDVPADDPKHLGWTRTFYRDLFAATGGVPVPDDRTDGLHVNWPDLDLLDPTWNGSGLSVQQLLHKENYPRLQSVKSIWDPRDVFRNAVSVRLP